MSSQTGCNTMSIERMVTAFLRETTDRDGWLGWGASCADVTVASFVAASRGAYPLPRNSSLSDGQLYRLSIGRLQLLSLTGLAALLSWRKRYGPCCCLTEDPTAGETHESKHHADILSGVSNSMETFAQIKTAGATRHASGKTEVRRRRSLVFHLMTRIVPAAGPVPCVHGSTRGRDSVHSVTS